MESFLTYALTSLISAAITIPISAIVLLWVMTKKFKAKRKEYVTALKAATFQVVVAFLLSLIILAPPVMQLFNMGATLLAVLAALIAAQLIANTYLIKTFYKLETKKAAIKALSWTLILNVMMKVIGAILTVAFGV